MTLYKYRGNSTNTDKIFTDKKVWLSNAAGLNDPFECSIQEIAKDWIDEHVKGLKQGQLSGLVLAFIQSKKTNTHFFGLSISEAENLWAFLKHCQALKRNIVIIEILSKVETGIILLTQAQLFLALTNN